LNPSGPPPHARDSSASTTVPPLFGPYGGAALREAEALVRGGADACWFHGFDPACFEACAKHGLAACVEFKTFRADFAAHPELIPTGADGGPIRFGRLVQGVCLSRREFTEKIERDLLAGIRACRPAGVWLDYLSGAGWFETPRPDLQESCFCDACVAEFCQATGIDADRPAEILARHADRWRRHACQRIARFGARYAELIRAHLPGCVVGAYMCPWRPEEFDGALTRIFAQDYDLLAGAIDVFTPLIYARKSGRSADWGRRFLDGAGDFVPAGRKVQLILDVLDFPHSLLAAAESATPTWGVQVFGGAEIFTDPARGKTFRAAADRIRQAVASSGRR